ncbi:MAG: ATP-binding cassette domain-containing protein [Actinomycetota bacterium]
MTSADTAVASGAEIRVLGLQKSYSGRMVVDVDDLTLGDRPIEGLLGPNGAGKTTLMRMIMNSVTPDAGSVSLRTPDGVTFDLTSLPTHKMAHHGVVKSTQVITDFDQLTILDSMLLALAQTRHEWPVGRSAEKALAAEHHDEIRHHLDFFGFEDGSAIAMSAGEKKLLDIVRCLLLKPSILLLDEPTAGLPDDITAKVMATIRDLAASGTSVVIVEHDLDVIWELCDEVTFMAEGRVLMKGEPSSIRANATVIEKYLGAGHG